MAARRPPSGASSRRKLRDWRKSSFSRSSRPFFRSVSKDLYQIFTRGYVLRSSSSRSDLEEEAGDEAPPRAVPSPPSASGMPRASASARTKVWVR